MCRGNCPVCGHYSCSCSRYDLRDYQDRHRFDNPFGGNVLARWEQNDRDERVECELRDRARHEREAEEREQEERRLERAARERREAEQIEYERQMYDAECAERERAAAEAEATEAVTRESPTPGSSS